MRWAAESGPALVFALSAFSAGSEPDESSVRFFLCYVAFADNKN